MPGGTHSVEAKTFMPLSHVVATTLGVLPAPAALPSQYRVLVDVKGRGVLIAIGVADGRNYHHFKITIDDRTLVEDYLCATHGPRVNNGLSLAAVFNHKLLIEIHDDGALSTTTNYWAAWNSF